MTTPTMCMGDRPGDVIVDVPGGPRGRGVNPSDPLNVARAFVAQNYSHHGVRTIHWQDAAFHVWSGGAYREVPSDEIESPAWRWLETEGITPQRKIVAEVMAATRALVTLPQSHRSPCWLSIHPASMRDPRYVVSTSSGLVDLRSRERFDPTPALFSHHALGVSFEPDAPPPVAWLEFLDQVFGDDVEAKRLCAEWAGYCLTADTSQQKAMLFVGPKRGGKGTYARMIAALLGREAVAGPTLSSLAGNFGLEPLLRKALAIVGDARINQRADMQVIAERILSVVGEDVITIDRKMRPAWTGQLGTRVMILTNELPRLTDPSGALASRFITVTSSASFFGREDHGLFDRLCAELPGILNWALDGLEQLLERGRFLQPTSAAEAIQELADLGSPISAFVRDEVEVGAGDEFRALKAHVYDRWRDWCTEHGYSRPGSEPNFSRELRAALPSLSTVRLRNDGDRTRAWAGIRLRERAYE